MYKYYKIKMDRKEFDDGFNFFVKQDKEFLEALNHNSDKLKVEIYKKYNRMGFVNSKFNYVVVNVEGKDLDNDSLNLVFGDYLKKVNIKSKNFMDTCLYLIFVVVNTKKINSYLLKFIKKGFHIEKKGKYERYVTIPVVFEEDDDTLYIGCYPDNKLEAKWFGKEMIVWILENLQKNNIKFNEIGLVKSNNSKKDDIYVSNYERIYTKYLALEMEQKKKVGIFFLIFFLIMCFCFISDFFLVILSICLIVYLGLMVIKIDKSYLRFYKIKLNSLSMYDLKKNIDDVWRSRKSLESIIFIDKFMNIYFDNMFKNNQDYYIILLDDYYEKDLLNVVDKLSCEFRKNIIILKNENNEFLKFIKADNDRMKRNFLKSIGKIL